MKTIADINSYDSDTVQLTEQLLARLNRSRDIYSRILFIEQRQGQIDHLGISRDYRLFFLLEGKVFLKGLDFGKYMLYPKKLMLLPPASNISCGVAQRAKYVLLGCPELTQDGNVAYFEQLQEHACDQQSGFTALPIHEKLEKVLQGFSVYAGQEYYYESIYDAVFLILRSIYSKEEMLSLFSPILDKEQTKQQMQETLVVKKNSTMNVS